MTAEELKQALYGRYHAHGGQMPGPWTVIEEWRSIDVLAIAAWSSPPNGPRDVGQPRIGHEVKVSRSDYRRELLRPHKRTAAVEWCHQFYFAVPAGLLKPDELAYEESLWEDGDFERVKCPLKCSKPPRYERHNRYVPAQGTVAPAKVPVPIVVQLERWDRVDEDYARKLAERHGITPEEYIAQERERILASRVNHDGWVSRRCPECNGKGYVKGSRVEREAPTLWVPNDVGLIEVDGRGCRIKKRAPIRNRVPDIDHSEFGQFARWVSMRPDPRHHPARQEAAA